MCYYLITIWYWHYNEPSKHQTNHYHVPNLEGWKNPVDGTNGLLIITCGMCPSDTSIFCLVVEPYPSEKWWSSSVGMSQLFMENLIKFHGSKPPDIFTTTTGVFNGFWSRWHLLGKVIKFMFQTTVPRSWTAWDPDSFSCSLDKFRMCSCAVSSSGGAVHLVERIGWRKFIGLSWIFPIEMPFWGSPFSNTPISSYTVHILLQVFFSYFLLFILDSCPSVWR